MGGRQVVAPVSSLGSPRLHLRATDSTNERARALAVAGAPHGTLVTASQQSAGHGRQGRSWSAPAGSSLLMSLLLRWPTPERRATVPAAPAGGDRLPQLLPLLAAVAVADVAGEQALIKWPNDIVVREQPADAPARLAKLAGVLVEARLQEGWAVLGIGLNVAVDLEQLPPELRPGTRAEGRQGLAMPAATMGCSPQQIEPTLARLLSALTRRLAEPGEATLAAWRSRDALLGRDISWQAGRGRADGVDGIGRLVVALPGGRHTTLSAGEVHLEAID